MEVFILACVMTMGKPNCYEIKHPIGASVTPYQCVHIAMDLMSKRLANKDFTVKKFGCRPKTEGA